MWFTVEYCHLGLAEIGEGFVVGEDLHGERGTMEVVAPRLQGANDGEEFAVIDVVISFSGGERLGEVGAGVPISVGISLEKDGTGHVFGGVSGDGEGSGEIREAKDGFCEEEAFEGIEGGLARRGPIPREVFLGEIKERAGDIGIIGDESSVETGEAKERANIFHLGWSWPTCDAVELYGVHGQLAGFHDHAEVFDLVGGELALFELQMKVKFGHALENAFRAFFMEGGVGGVDKKIVHVDDEPSFGNHMAEGVVHEALEGGGGVGESEEHHRGFEKSFVGNEGCLPLVTVLDSYVVVSPPDVELGEDLSIL